VKTLLRNISSAYLICPALPRSLRPSYILPGFE